MLADAGRGAGCSSSTVTMPHAKVSNFKDLGNGRYSILLSGYTQVIAGGLNGPRTYNQTALVEFDTSGALITWNPDAATTTAGTTNSTYEDSTIRGMIFIY